MVNVTRMHVTFGPSLQGRRIVEIIQQGWGLSIECACGHSTRWACEFLFHRFRGSLQHPAAEIGPRLKCVCEAPRIRLDVFQCIQGEGGYDRVDKQAARLAAWHAQPHVAGTIGAGGEVRMHG
jgi:hypothetical protein